MLPNDLILKTVNGNNICINSEYYYLTCHRQENTDETIITEILYAMNSLDGKTVYPVHPRNAALVRGIVENYARIDLLYEHGGIYMDTDVELKHSLDPLLHQEAFCGVEKWQVINFGGCSGSVKGNRAISRFLDVRKRISFLDEQGRQNRNTCGYYDTGVAIEMGYRLDGTSQSIDGINIYASDYFHPYDYMSGNINITEHTYSIHWFNGGWLDEMSREANKKTFKEYNDLYKSCVIY